MKHIHFVGIKGVGMTALALWAKGAGYKVTGSDLEEEFITDEVLKKAGIMIKNGFDRKDLKEVPDMVVTTGAHGGKTNPENLAFILEGVEVLSHGQALGKFMEGKDGISISGVGGKTTTSAMISSVLTNSNSDPSYAVGVSEIFPLGEPGHFGKGKYFIAEADEYASCPQTDRTPRFMYQHPKIAVVTNIEYDHPDLYNNLSETKSAFINFINNSMEDSVAVLNNDNSNIRSIVSKIRRNIITYGFSKDVMFRIDNLHFSQGKTLFDIKADNINIGKFSLSVPGKYNALNAAATICVALHIGISADQINKSLGEFLGTKRRFELIADKNGRKLYDDYAHHPSEIQMTLMAARDWFPRNKIICIFQPHTYSRTKSLLSDFAQSFGFADEVLILPIFASAREKEDKSINSSVLAAEISHYHQNVSYMDTTDKLLSYVKKTKDSNSVIITMGAGDVYKLGPQIEEII